MGFQLHLVAATRLDWSSCRNGAKVFIKNVSDLPSELQQRFTFVEVDAID